MKIALVSFGFVDVTLPLAKAMAETGVVDVDVYLIFSQNYKYQSIVDFRDTPVPDGLLDDELSMTVLGEEIRKYITDSGKKFKVNVFMYHNMKLRDFKNLKLSYGFAKLLEKRNYDVIHFNGNVLFQVFISLFSRGIPKVHTIHDFTPHLGERKNIVMNLQLPERFNRYLARSERHKMVHADAVKNSAYKITGKARNIHTVFYGPLDIYTYYEVEGDCSIKGRYILFFGRIVKYKGIGYLIDAYSKIRERFPDVKLVVAGSGEIDFLKEKLDANPEVILIHRHIGNRELADLIRHSSLVVCPYIEATQSAVVQTAYAFLKPVIATRVGGIPEVVEHDVTGKLVPPFDSAALADEIGDLLSGETTLDVLSQNIRTGLKKELDWDFIAKQTIDVYNKSFNVVCRRR